MSGTNKDIDWGCCSLGLEDDQYLTCTNCKKSFHEACLSLTKSCGPATATSDVEAWTCLLCTKKQPKNDNTPLNRYSNVTTRPSKRQAPNSPANTEDPKPITRDDMQDILEGFGAEIRNMVRSTMSSILHAELKPIKEEIADIKNSMTYMNLRFEEINKEHAESQATIKLLQDKNCLMQSKIDEMNARINQLEQNARSNNVEIQCVPEKKDENLFNIVSQLGKAVGHQVNEENISHCTRIAKFNKDSNRPRSIVVQFNTSRTRDHFLAAAIRFNKSKPDDRLNTSHINMSGAKIPIFVTEHLSACNKALHAAARLKAKELGYKYVWIRGGRVYMRKSDNAEYKIIRDINSLGKLV